MSKTNGYVIRITKKTVEMLCKQCADGKKCSNPKCVIAPFRTGGSHGTLD